MHMSATLLLPSDSPDSLLFPNVTSSPQFINVPDVQWFYIAPYTICTFCYLTLCISPGLHTCPATMIQLWRCCGCVTFLQLTDPLHQGIQRALSLQPVSGCGVGQHALLLL